MAEQAVDNNVQERLLAEVERGRRLGLSDEQLRSGLEKVGAGDILLKQKYNNIAPAQSSENTLSVLSKSIANSALDTALGVQELAVGAGKLLTNDATFGDEWLDKEIDRVNSKVKFHIDPDATRGLLEQDENGDYHLTNWLSFVNMFGQSVPYMLSGAGFARGAKLLGVASKGGLKAATVAGTSVASAPMAFEAGKEAGLDNATSIALSIPIGLGMGLLENLGILTKVLPKGIEGMLLPSLLKNPETRQAIQGVTKDIIAKQLAEVGKKGMTKETFETTAKAVAKGVYKDVVIPTVKNMTKQGGVEALEEFLQEGFTNSMEAFYDQVWGQGKEVGQGRFGTELLSTDPNDQALGISFGGYGLGKEAFLGYANGVIGGFALGGLLSAGDIKRSPQLEQTLYGYIDSQTKVNNAAGAIEKVQKILDVAVNSGKISTEEAQEMLAKAQQMTEASARTRGLDNELSAGTSYDIWNAQAKILPEFDNQINAFTQVFGTDNLEQAQANVNAITDPLERGKRRSQLEAIAPEYIKTIARKGAVNAWLENVGATGKAEMSLPKALEAFDIANGFAPNAEMITIKGGQQNITPENLENKGADSIIATDEQGDEIHQRTPQRTDGGRAQIHSRFQEARNYIRGNASANSSEQQGLSTGESNDNEKRAALDYAKQNNLWVDDLYSLGTPQKGGGNENTLAVNHDDGAIYKANNLFNYKNSVADFLDGVEGHNEIFPNTPYELVGFTGIDSRGSRAPHIEPIIKQGFVYNATQATQSEIDNYMVNDLGFEKVNDHTFKNAEYTVSDLRPRNVLKGEDGNIYVIDDIVHRNKQSSNNIEKQADSNLSNPAQNAETSENPDTKQPKINEADLPVTELKPKKKKKSKLTFGQSKDIGELSENPVSIRDLIITMIGKGSINTEDFVRATGFGRLNPKTQALLTPEEIKKERRKQDEFKNRAWLLSDKGESLDEFSQRVAEIAKLHGLFTEDSRHFSTIDIQNEILDVLNSLTKQSDYNQEARRILEQRRQEQAKVGLAAEDNPADHFMNIPGLTAEEIDAINEQDQELANERNVDEQLANEVFDEINQGLELLSDKEAIDLANQYFSKFANEKGEIDYDKAAEAQGGFDPDYLELHPKAQDFINEILYGENSRRVESSASKSGVGVYAEKDSIDKAGKRKSEQNADAGAVEERLKNAKSKLDKAKRKLSDAEKKIADTQSEQSKMFKSIGEEDAGRQSDLFGSITGNDAKAIIDPLEREVKELQAEVEKLTAEKERADNTLEGQQELDVESSDNEKPMSDEDVLDEYMRADLQREFDSADVPPVAYDELRSRFGFAEGGKTQLTSSQQKAVDEAETAIRRKYGKKYNLPKPNKNTTFDEQNADNGSEINKELNEQVEAAEKARNNNQEKDEDSPPTDYQRGQQQFTPISEKAFGKLLDKLKKAFPQYAEAGKIITSREDLLKAIRRNGLKINEVITSQPNVVEIKTSKGKPYGILFPDGTMYLNPEQINANTPIHEFGHVWERMMPNTFKRGLELLRASEQGRTLIEQIRKSGKYGTDTAAIEREALVTAIGNMGESYFNASALTKFKDWVKNFFATIGRHLGFKQKLSPNEAFENFVRKVVKDEILGGKALKAERSQNIELNSLPLQNDKGEVNYGELTRQAERILNGTARLNTLSLAEEQGRRRGDRTAVEASILIGASESASRKGQDSELRSEVIARQEKLLSDYADENNLWIDESKVAKEASVQLPPGFESKVYRSADGKTVTKFVNYRILDNTPKSYLDNRIALNNSIVSGSNTEYSLKGFARNPETGQFQFVVEQTYVQGENVDFNDAAQKQAFDAEMQKRGFKELTTSVYISKDYVLYDVKNGNVKITPEGYAFIDILTTLNDKKTGGTREYGKGDITQQTDFQYATSPSDVANNKRLIAKIPFAPNDLNLGKEDTTPQEDKESAGVKWARMLNGIKGHINKLQKTNPNVSKGVAVSDYVSGMLNTILEITDKKGDGTTKRFAFANSIEDFRNSIGTADTQKTLSNIYDHIINDEELTKEASAMLAQINNWKIQRDHLEKTEGAFILDSKTATNAADTNEEVQKSLAKGKEAMEMKTLKKLFGNGEVAEWIAGTLESYVLKVSSLPTFAKYVAGGESSVMNKLASSLNKAQAKQALMVENVTEALKPIVELLGDNSFYATQDIEKAAKENVGDYFENHKGNTTKISKAERLSIYLTLKNRNIRGRFFADGKNGTFNLQEYRNKQGKILRKAEKLEVNYKDYKHLEAEFNTPEWVEAIKAWEDVTEQMYEYVNEAHLALTGTNLRKVEGFYFPLFHGDGLTNIEDYIKKNKFIDDLVNAKARQPKQNAEFLAVDVLSAMNNYAQANSKFASYAVPMKNLETFMDLSEGFMRENGMIKQLEWWAKFKKEFEDPSSDRLGELHKRIMSSYVISRLGLNPFTVAKQLSSLPIGNNVIPNKYLIPAWKELANSAKHLSLSMIGKEAAYTDTMNEIMRESAYGRVRFTGGGVNFFDEVRKQGIKDISITMFGKTHKIPLDKLSKRTMEGIQAGDRSVAAVFWIAAKAQVEAEANFAIGSDEYWNAVDEIFTKAVTESQSSVDSVNRAHFTKDMGLIARSLTLFSGQAFSNFNSLMGKVIEYANNPTAESRYALTRGVINIAVWNVLMAATVDALRIGLGDDDDDKKLSKMQKAAIRNFHQNLPLISPIISGIFEREKIDNPALEVLNAATSAANKMYEGEWSRAVKEGIEFGASGIGIPLTPVRFIRKNIMSESK